MGHSTRPMLFPPRQRRCCACKVLHAGTTLECGDRRHTSLVLESAVVSVPLLANNESMSMTEDCCQAQWSNHTRAQAKHSGIGHQLVVGSCAVVDPTSYPFASCVSHPHMDPSLDDDVAGGPWCKVWQGLAVTFMPFPVIHERCSEDPAESSTPA